MTRIAKILLAAVFFTAILLPVSATRDPTCGTCVEIELNNTPAQAQPLPCFSKGWNTVYGHFSKWQEDFDYDCFCFTAPQSDRPIDITFTQQDAGACEVVLWAYNEDGSLVEDPPYVGVYVDGVSSRVIRIHHAYEPPYPAYCVVRVAGLAEIEYTITNNTGVDADSCEAGPSAGQYISGEVHYPKNVEPLESVVSHIYEIEVGPDSDHLYLMIPEYIDMAIGLWTRNDIEQGDTTDPVDYMTSTYDWETGLPGPRELTLDLSDLADGIYYCEVAVEYISGFGGQSAYIHFDLEHWPDPDHDDFNNFWPNARKLDNRTESGKTIGVPESDCADWYKFIIAPDCSELRVSMHNEFGLATLSLYETYESSNIPDSGVRTFLPYQDTQFGLHDREVVIENPQGGMWYILVGTDTYALETYSLSIQEIDGNDTSADADPLGLDPIFSSLSDMDDTDWYRFEIPEYALNYEITVLGDSEHLELMILGESLVSALDMSSNDGSLIKSVFTEQMTPAGYVRVCETGGDVINYEIIVQFNEAADDIEDATEFLTDRETLGVVTYFDPWDWYRYTPGNLTSRLTITLSPTSQLGGGDVDLMVYDSNHSIVDVSQQSGNAIEVVELEELDNGPYFILVKNKNDDYVYYTLDIETYLDLEIPTGPQQELLPSITDHGPVNIGPRQFPDDGDDTCETADQVFGNAITDAAISTSDVEDWYKFTVDPGIDTVWIELQSDTGELIYVLYSDCGTEPLTWREHPVPGIPLVQNYLQPGTYYLMVQYTSGGQITYSIDFSFLSCDIDNTGPRTYILNCPLSDLPAGTTSHTMRVAGIDNCTSMADLTFQWAFYNEHGLINGWTFDDDGQIELLNLSPGQYRFYARAVDLEGNRDSTEAFCDFTIIGN